MSADNHLLITNVFKVILNRDILVVRVPEGFVDYVVG